MKRIPYTQAQKYMNRDLIVRSDFLKEYCKKNAKTCNHMIEFIADEVPMPASKIRKVIKDCFGEHKYEEIMTNSSFFSIKY